MKKESNNHQRKLKDLKKEYQEIEQKCKTKIIDDLANLYFINEPTRSSYEDETRNQKRTIRSRSINIEILQDGSVKTSKVIRSSNNQNRHELSDEDSLAKSVSISISTKSSNRCQKSNNRSKKQEENASNVLNNAMSENDNEDDDDDECDTLNAIDNISIQEESNSQMCQNDDIIAENSALRKKYKKYKLLKTKFIANNVEMQQQRKDIEMLKSDVGRLLKENAELKLKNSMNTDAEGRRLQRQNSIHEAPVRDTQDMCVQTHAQAGIEMSMRFLGWENVSIITITIHYQ